MSMEEERSWTEINLDHLAHNVSVIRKKTGKNVKMLGVVKSDAYGHGVVEIAKKLQQLGTDYLATAWLKEASELRQSGVTLPILILSHTSASQAEELIAFDAMPTVFDLDFARKLNQQAKGRKIKVHLKIDTGMTRLGFHFCNDGSASDLQTIHDICEAANLPNLEIEGIFSHFASSDEEEGQNYTNMQFTRFTALIKKLEDRGLHIPIKHICNSAATLLHPEMHLDMVRCGIILYGAYPSAYVKEQLSSDEMLKPLLSFKAKVTQTRTIPKDVCISYGRKYTTTSEEKVAVVSAGYADGFRRMLSGSFHVLIHGKYAPIRGTVCMDQTVVGISEIPGVRPMDTATLIGRDGESEITVDEMAKVLHTINYEIFCLIGRRVPRIYLEDNKIVAKTEYLNY